MLGLPFCPTGNALSGVSGKAAPHCSVLVKSRHMPPGSRAQRSGIKPREPKGEPLKQNGAGEGEARREM